MPSTAPDSTTVRSTAQANIQCPGPAWDPDAGVCSSGAGTCEYPGDKKLHGGATGVAENYGCAAASFGWPSTSADSGELQTPICKTYVDDCTYSTKATRKYKYEKAAALFPRILNDKAALWHKWVQVFEKIGQQRAVVPFLPLRDPQLNADTYTSLLLHFMEHDPPELLRLISEWPSSVYDTTGLIKAAQVPVIRCCCGGI